MSSQCPDAFNGGIHQVIVKDNVDLVSDVSVQASDAPARILPDHEAPPKSEAKMCLQSSSHKSEDPAVKASKKSKKDPRAPKGVKSSYNFFYEEVKAKVKHELDLAGLTLTDLNKEVGRRWRELPAMERSKFEALSSLDKERYDAEKNKYDKTFLKEVSGHGPLTVLKSRLKAVKKDTNVSMKAKSTYLFFSEEMRLQISLENPGLKSSVVGRKLWRRWKEADDKELERYMEMANADQERSRVIGDISLQRRGGR